MNQVKAGAILNYVIIGLNTLLGLLYTPYMLHMLGQNEYGLYSLVASIIAYLTILDFGFGNAIVRYTAKFRAEGKQREQWEMFGMFLIVYTLIGFAAFLIGLGLYFNVEALFERTMSAEEVAQARTMIMLLIVNLAITFPFSMFGSIITAYEDFVFQKVVAIVRLLLCTSVIILLLHVGYRAVAMVAAQTAFNIATLLLNYLYCVRKIKIKIAFSRFNRLFVKEITIYSFWLFLNTIMDRIYWSTGQFVLGAVVGTAAVAVYSVAILLQQMYMSFSTSIANVLLPKITAMVSLDKGAREVSDLFIRTGRIQCIVMSAVLSGFIVFGRGFIDIWAGPEYATAYPITLIFFVSLFVPLIQNTGITILQARNRMKFRSLLYLGISFASLIGQVVLARRFGTMGCAVSIGAALIIGQGLVMNVYYAKRQEIAIARFWREIGRMMVVPAIFTVSGLLTTRYVNYSAPLVLVTGICVYLLLFVPAFWRWSMNGYERNLLLSPIKKLVDKYVVAVK